MRPKVCTEVSQGKSISAETTAWQRAEAVLGDRVRE